MTARQVYEYALIELNKKQAPSLLLEDYIYFINKVIQQFVNKKYNPYDLNQQIDDDLAVLRVLDFAISLSLNGSYYSGLLPSATNDEPPYLHMLNCKVVFQVAKTFGCYKIGDSFEKPASRLHSSAARRVEDNHYFQSSYKNPYFYRDGVNLEIRSGKTDLMIPVTAYIDYLRIPASVTLTQDEIDEVVDNSQILEFPEYVCQEILNDLVKLLLENSSDPRLQTNIPINQSIASPMQEAQRR